MMHSLFVVPDDIAANMPDSPEVDIFNVDRHGDVRGRESQVWGWIKSRVLE